MAAITVIIRHSLNGRIEFGSAHSNDVRLVAVHRDDFAKEIIRLRQIFRLSGLQSKEPLSLENAQHFSILCIGILVLACEFQFRSLVDCRGH